MLLVNFSDWTAQQHFPSAHLFKSFGFLANSLSAQIVKDDWKNRHSQCCHGFPRTSSGASFQTLRFSLRILSKLMLTFWRRSWWSPICLFFFLLTYYYYFLTRFDAISSQTLDWFLLCTHETLIPCTELQVCGKSSVDCRDSPLGCVCWSSFTSDPSLGRMHATL